MKTFLESYIQTALWSSANDDGESLYDDYTVDDFAPETIAKMKEDCTAFQKANADNIGTNIEQAGQDFWLTRNRHGSGFWDGRWKDDVGLRLTHAAHAYCEQSLYVGDDEKLYLA